MRTFQTFAAFSLGPIALALAGPLAELVGAPTVLAAGAAITAASVVAALAVPSVRTVTWHTPENPQQPQ